MRLLLDTSVLARACHPSKHRDVQRWFHALVARQPPEHELLVSPISLYELRRGLTRLGAHASLEQLSQLARHLVDLPVTVEAVEQAAILAEDAPDAPDADLLLAAQARLAGAVLVHASDTPPNFGDPATRAWHTLDPTA